MREIRSSGSEGGGAETNRLSLPLSAAAGHSFWISRTPMVRTDRAAPAALLVFSPQTMSAPGGARSGSCRSQLLHQQGADVVVAEHAVGAQGVGAVHLQHARLEGHLHVGL